MKRHFGNCTTTDTKWRRRNITSKTTSFYGGKTWTKTGSQIGSGKNEVLRQIFTILDRQRNSNIRNKLKVDNKVGTKCKRKSSLVNWKELTRIDYQDWLSNTSPKRRWDIGRPRRRWKGENRLELWRNRFWDLNLRHVHEEDHNGDILTYRSHSLFLQISIESVRCYYIYHMRLVAGLPSRRPGFDPGSVHVEFVVDRVALGQVFPRVFLFSPVSFIPPLLHYLEKWKKELIIFLFIFITRLHNKP
jgi:hypothetical protein